MELDITLPFLALLRCNLGVAIFNNDDKHARRLHEIMKLFVDEGWEGFRIRLFKEESWLEKVRTLAEEFSWDKYRKPELPKVKPHNGTLEFVGGSASQRALAVAIRAMTKHDIDNIPVTLVLS
jgi:hypothetical protein